MITKSGEISLRFYLVAGLTLLAFLVAAMYIAQDANYWNFEFTQEVTPPTCDYFSGRWVYDNVSVPLYKEMDCTFMEDSFSCEKYGRKDLQYQNWRWQPHDCDLPRFNARLLLEKLRGKKLYFVGDSVNRNQWRSMMCLIESALPSSSNKAIKTKDNLQYLEDTEYNLTIGFYWSPFLVESNCDDPQYHQITVRAVRLNAIEKHAIHWNDADFLIFDSYAWWHQPKMISLWGDSINKTIPTKYRGYEMALNTWSEWLEININRTKTKMFFMSLSPYNFKDFGVKSCNNISGPLKVKGKGMRGVYGLRNIAEETLNNLEKRGVKVKYLRITEMSESRVDAHPSIYRNFDTKMAEESKRDPITYADCLHWCLPGVPDFWNQILYTYLIRS